MALMQKWKVYQLSKVPKRMALMQQKEYMVLILSYVWNRDGGVCFLDCQSQGQRFNALMTIQVPLKQAEPSLSDWSLVELEPCQRLEGNFSDGALYGEGEVCRSAQPLGSTAARVSRGSEFDIWPGLCIQSATRHPSEHVTVTIVMYNVVSGGVPSARDVIAAIDDLETLYQSCMASGNLSDSLMDFMKTPLSEDTCAQVKAKLQFKPPSIPVHNYDVFPMP